MAIGFSLFGWLISLWDEWGPWLVGGFCLILALDQDGPPGFTALYGVGLWALIALGRRSLQEQWMRPSHDEALEARLRSVLSLSGRSHLQPVVVNLYQVPFYNQRGRRFIVNRLLMAKLTDDELAALVRYESVRAMLRFQVSLSLLQVIEFLPFAAAAWCVLAYQTPFAWVALLIATYLTSVSKRERLVHRLRIPRLIAAYLKQGADPVAFLSAYYKVFGAYFVAGRTGIRIVVRLVATHVARLAGLTQAKVIGVARAAGAPPPLYMPDTPRARALIAFLLPIPIGLLVWAVLTLVGSAPDHSARSRSVGPSSLEDRLKRGPEAREWLMHNGNPSALAGNRFGHTQEALSFVDRLYELGATAVYVTDVRDESNRIRIEGGPYADALILSLPKNLESRRKLFALAAVEAEREGFDPEQDRGQAQLFLWWD